MKKHLYIFFIFILSFTGLSAQINETKPDEESVVILGGGVGALTSAIYLQRAGIQTLVIEGKTPGGAIAQSPSVHNWPGEMEIDGYSLVEKIRKQALANGARIVEQEAIAVDFTNSRFTISTKDLNSSQTTHKIKAKACIIATGSNPKLLGIPGESGKDGYWAKGVYSCAVCDGSLYRNKTVAVIGGGDSAITEANYLSNIAKKVYVILRSDHFRTAETIRMQELIKKSNVEILYNTKINEIQGNGQQVTHLNLSTSKKLAIDGVFVAIGALPNTDLFAEQLALDTSGYIVLTKGQKTSVPGVFAIGDVVDPYYKQAISAAGDGAKAALEVEQYLSGLPKEGEEHPLASPKVVAIASTSSPVEDIPSKEAFYKAIGNADTPVVVEFYSPFCSPCKALMAKLEEAAKKHQGKIRFYKVNVSEFSNLAETYSIFSVPTLLIFDTQGKMIKKATGQDESEKALNNL